MGWALILGMVLALPAALYFPQPMPELTRARIAERAESHFIEAADGTRLHAWHLRGSPLVIYFGGNAEEVSWMLAPAARAAAGSGWLLVDYRGYGSSAGAPSEAALTADAIRWYDYAKEKLGAQRIIAFGRSLGSGVAVQLAAERRLEAVVLVAPFDSLTDVGQRHYPFLPVSWMLKHRFDSLGRAPTIAAPLLCLVAEHDDIIPVIHSKRLYDAWKGPKRWVELRGAGHNSADDAPAFWQAIREFLVQAH
jgi:pimeloyl-ACP methyl ester carboxylesterase